MPVSLAKTMLPRTPNQRRFKMNKLYVYAGIAASVIMIAIGIGFLVLTLRLPWRDGQES
jgi:hypothetical protein